MASVPSNPIPYRKARVFASCESHRLKDMQRVTRKIQYAHMEECDCYAPHSAWIQTYGPDGTKLDSIPIVFNPSKRRWESRTGRFYEFKTLKISELGDYDIVLSYHNTNVVGIIYYVGSIDGNHDRLVVTYTGSPANAPLVYGFTKICTDRESPKNNSTATYLLTDPAILSTKIKNTNKGTEMEKIYVDRVKAIEKVADLVTEALNSSDLNITVVKSTTRDRIHFWIDDEDLEGSPIGFSVRLDTSESVEESLAERMNELKDRQARRQIISEFAQDE